MARHVLVALTEPLAGDADEYNEWYTKQHLPDVVRVPGVKSAQRFKLATEPKSPDVRQYLALYEVETDDIEGVMAELAKRAGTPVMPISATLDTGRTVAGVYAPITEVVKSPDLAPAK